MDILNIPYRRIRGTFFYKSVYISVYYRVIPTYNVDNINEGRVLFDLYKETGKPKYKRAINLLYSQLQSQPRTETGNFWHKKMFRGLPKKLA